MNKFNVGDRVAVNAINHTQHEVQGTISRTFEDGDTYLVDLETGRTSGFFEKELELVDPEKEALLRLAETLDKARLQANASGNYVVESQRGVYGQIVLSLHDTLEQVVGAGQDDYFDASLEADKVYLSILDGNSVREALKQWEAQK